MSRVDWARIGTKHAARQCSIIHEDEIGEIADLAMEAASFLAGLENGDEGHGPYVEAFEAEILRLRKLYRFNDVTRT